MTGSYYSVKSNDRDEKVLIFSRRARPPWRAWSRQQRRYSSECVVTFADSLGTVQSPRPARHGGRALRDEVISRLDQIYLTG